jgi:hypothetical protein
MTVLQNRSTTSDKIRSTYKYKSGEINHEKLNKLRDKAHQYLLALYNQVHNKPISFLDYNGEVYRKCWKLVLELTNEEETAQHINISNHGRK